MTQRFTRRTISGFMLANAVAAPYAAFAQAVEFPTRAIRLVVPFGAGTTTDTITRVVADAMGRTLGQTIEIGRAHV